MLEFLLAQTSAASASGSTILKGEGGGGGPDGRQPVSSSDCFGQLLPLPLTRKRTAYVQSIFPLGGPSRLGDVEVESA